MRPFSCEGCASFHAQKLALVLWSREETSGSRTHCEVKVVMRVAECFLCGSTNTLVLPYLRLNSRSLSRNLAYALPVPVGRVFAALSKRFQSAYATVAVNKTYFDR